MSRSTIHKQELPNRDHLVCIIGAIKEGSQVVITFADGKNKQLDKSYDFNSSEFIKMCQAAGTVKDKEVLNSVDCIGKTLWITLDSNNIIETFPYIEGVDKPFKYELKAELPLDKKKVIEQAREMIKTVESGGLIKEAADFANKLQKQQEEDEDSI